MLSGGIYDASSNYSRVTNDYTYAAGTFNANNGTVIFASSDTDNTIAGGASQFNDVNLGNGLVGYWKLDEQAEGGAPGGVLDSVDSSGYGNHGEWVDNPTPSLTKPAPFRFDNSGGLDFDGDDMVQVANSTVWNIFSKPFTVCAWVKATASLDKGQIVGQYNTGGTPRWGLRLEDGSASGDGAVFYENDGTGAERASATTDIEDGQWHHIAAVIVPGGTGLIYQDGVDDTDSSNIFNADFNSAYSMTIGKGENTQPFTGSIDDVRIYNRALPALEIKILATSEVHGTADGVFTLVDTMDIDGTITFRGGTLDAGVSANPDIFISGDWTMADGSFNSRAGSVTFDGGDTLQNITGDTTFYDLWKIDYTNNSVDASLLFEAGSSTRITNNIKLYGIDETNDRVRLDSSDGSTQFILDISTGGQTVSYVTVSNSNITDNDLSAENSSSGTGTDKDAGSPQWVFVAAPSIYTWNGGGALGVWTDAANWDVGSGYPDSNSEMAIITSGAVDITVGADLILGNLNISGTYGGTVILGGDLTLDSSGGLSGGMTLTAGTLDVSVSNYEISVDGDWDGAVPGTLSSRGGTVTFQAADTDNTLTSGSQTFFDVIFNNADAIWQLQDNMDVDGSLRVTAGTIDTNEMYFYIADDIEMTTGGTFAASTGTIIFNADDTGNTITSAGTSFVDVTFDSANGNGRWTLQDDMTAGDVIITDGTLTDNANTITSYGDISIANIKGALASTGLWIQAATGDIENPYWYDNAFKQLKIADNVISTMIDRVIISESLTLGANANLTGGQYFYIVYTTVNDFLDLGTGSNITISRFFIYPNNGSVLDQKAISIDSSILIGYSNSSTIRLTGDLSVNSLG